MNAERKYSHCPECRTRLRLDHKPRLKDGFIWNTYGQKIAAYRYYAPCRGCNRRWMLEIGRNEWSKHSNTSGFY